MSQPADTVRAAIRTLKDLGDAVHATVNDAVSSTDRDQITERLRDLPFQAVRLAVAGVGQAIALADKVQNLLEEQGRTDKESETEPARRPETPARDSGRNGSVVAMPQQARAQANGTDEAARAQRAAARRAERPARSVPNKTTPKPAAAKAAAPKTARKSTPAAKKPAAAAKKPTAAKSTPAKSATPADLPLADYGSASLASVRARLRNLTQADLRKLRSYEKAHAARPAFITMYDNRLAKLRDTASS